MSSEAWITITAIAGILGTLAVAVLNIRSSTIQERRHTNRAEFDRQRDKVEQGIDALLYLTNGWVYLSSGLADVKSFNTLVADTKRGLGIRMKARASLDSLEVPSPVLDAYGKVFTEGTH